MKPTTKSIFELYVKELVKNAVTEQLQKEVPRMVKEQLEKMGTTLNESPKVAAPKEVDRTSIRAIMEKHFSMDGDTLQPLPPVSFGNSNPIIGNTSSVRDMAGHPALAPDLKSALTRDYSALVAAMDK